MSTAIHGFAAPGFERVADAFARVFAGNRDTGAALAVRVGGEAVVDLWGGVADERDGTPWSRDTTSVVFSCTKGLSSLLAARLVQDGRLDYDAPVGRYWPEFAVAGKEDTRVGQLLAHRSGVSAPRVELTIDDVVDWPRVVGLLAEQAPLWPTGTGHQYHALTHGWLIGEVIRRVTGGSVGEYFREVVTGPLDADAWIGLPDEEQHRVAHMQAGSTLLALVAQQAADRREGQIDWADRAMTLGAAFTPELVTDRGGFNDPLVRAAEIPGAGGVASARALAAIWSATVVETDGVRLLDDRTIAAATRPQSEGAPVFGAPAPHPRWGMGFQLPSLAREYLGASSFGHDGAGGQVAFADPAHGVGFAFLTNMMEAIDDERGTGIVDALRATLER